MKQKITLLLLFFSVTAFAQTDEDAMVRTALNHYIEGTSYNYPDRIRKAFYEDANLYLQKPDQELWIVKNTEYASWFEGREKGTFTGRIGNIISIDRTDNIATAKVEILIPKSNMRFVDLFLLKKLEGEWKILSKSATSHPSNQQGDRILFIVTNADSYGESDIPTGNSFAEIVRAYRTFVEAGYTVDFVSPKGGAIPLAYINTTDPTEKAYLYDADFMASLETTNSPDMIDASNYKALYYVGGGGAMYGVPENEQIQQISMDIYEKQNGIISAVCHGTAGIVNLKTADGQYLVANKRVNGYPDAFEHQDADYFKQFPFLIQKTIESRGGLFKHSDRNSSHLEVDGRLVTGQNHLSSELVAEKVIEILQAKQ